MPQIDDLGAALAAAGDDVLPVSQNRSTRKVTRAQLLAGLQPEITVAQGQLLGRRSSGAGGPEAIAVGPNLVMQSGTLAAVITPLDVPSLPAGAVPAAADLVPFAQAGRNVAIRYDAFMGGVAGLAGVDGSGLAVMAEGATERRTLGQALGAAVAVEAFGARGDGVSDDTAAFVRAVQSGRPLRLGPRTYVVNGQFTIARPGVTLLGVPGMTVLRRSSQAGNGAWIAVQADEFRADGIIFDANGPAVGVESWGVLVGSQCLRSEFLRCSFRNACGSTLGSGLVFLASDPAIAAHSVRDCSFSGNAAHGLWVQACAGVLVAGCRAFANARYGIVADYNDSAFSKKVRLAQILGNRCWDNERGIAVGNYNATNLQPPSWGNANPDAIGVLVSGNVCHDNSVYGISAAGSGLAIQGNLLSGNGVSAPGGGGLLANAAQSLVLDNVIAGSGVYGIDCGGSVEMEVRGNAISGGVYGINCGGSQDISVAGNRIRDCSVFAICAANVEADGNGVTFGLAAARVVIADNWIGMNGTCGGVWLRDGPADVLVARNHFVGSGLAGNCLWPDTDRVQIVGNRFNFSAQHLCNPVTVAGVPRLVFPDIADDVSIETAPDGVLSMVSARQAQMAGKLGFVRVTSGGGGYTQATVTIGGSGAGATARAVVSGGVVVGVEVTAAGSGYGAIGSSVPVTIAGDGTGAVAMGWSGTPLPDGRRLRIRCGVPVRFPATGASPVQSSWTGTDLDLPAGGEIEWTASAGAWRAGQSVAAGLLAGSVRHVAQGEPVGCTSRIGRGSPEGAVVAAPGSDWRNLDGGAGTTLWIKQTGTGATGWAAIA